MSCGHDGQAVFWYEAMGCARGIEASTNFLARGYYSYSFLIDCVRVQLNFAHVSCIRIKALRWNGDETTRPFFFGMGWIN